jgi:hypothetical protein
MKKISLFALRRGIKSTTLITVVACWEEKNSNFVGMPIQQSCVTQKLLIAPGFEFA